MDGVDILRVVVFMAATSTAAVLIRVVAISMLWDL